MRNVICPHCNETVPVPDDLAQGHCVRCGQALALETNITAEAPASSRGIQPEAYVERPPSDAAPELPERYESWEEFRSMSPAIQRELMHMVARAVPDLRSIGLRPLPENASEEIDDWGEPSGSVRLGADQRLPWQLGGWILVIGGALMSVGAVAASLALLAGRVEAGAPLMLLVFGLAGIGLGLYCAYFRGVRLPTELWAFEEGILLQRHGTSITSRWEDVLDFEVITETGLPVYWLTLKRGVSVKVAVNNNPEVMPLMEFVEIRLSAAQFLDRLKAIFKGDREPFGVVTLDRRGFEGPRFFAPWSEVRRVIADSQKIYVDWSRTPEWVGVPYEHVSFPYLVIAIAAVMIDEHERIAPLSA